MFNGRIRRSAYFLFNILSLIPAGAALAFDISNTSEPGIATGIFFVIWILPNLSFSIRRLHDQNRSGWWVLLTFIPLVQLVLYIMMLFVDGTVGRNRFGPDPKGRKGLGDSPISAQPAGPVVHYAAPTATEKNDRLLALERLAALRERGLLSDAEFAAEKARI